MGIRGQVGFVTLRFLFGAVVVILLGAFFLFPFLGFSEVYQVSEGREGVVVKEILRSGDYILPLRNGEIVPSKPPLFHWLGVGCARLLGQYDEFALRLPSALAALGCLLVLFWLAFSLVSLKAGILAALCLVTTNGFVSLATDGRVDMVWCFFVTAAIGVWLKAAGQIWAAGGEPSKISRGSFLLVALFCGLAVLAKGPLGVVLPLLVFSVISFYFWRFRGLRSFVRFEWLLSLLVALPWYVAATIHGQKDFIARQIVFENVGRFVGGEGITVKPFWFYLVHFWDQAAPWSFLVLAYVIFLLVQWWHSRKGEQKGEVTSRSATEQFLLKSSWLWLVSVVMFLSLSAGKRRAYLLSILPALALICSVLVPYYLQLLQKKVTSESAVFQARVQSRFLLLWTVVVAVVVLFAFFAGFGLIPTFGSFPRLAIEVNSFLPALKRAPYTEIAYFLGFSLSALFLWLLAFKKRSVTLFASALFVFLELILFVLLNMANGMKGITHGYRSFALEAAEVTKAEEPRFIKVRKDESFDGFFFYYPTRVLLHSPDKPLTEPGFYFARSRWLNESEIGRTIQQDITVLKRGGRQVDTPEQQVVLFRYEPTSVPSAAVEENQLYSEQ